MDKIEHYLISRDDGKLQIPYSEYESLLEKQNEIQRIHQVKTEVLDQLSRLLNGMEASPSEAPVAEQPPVHEEPAAQPREEEQEEERASTQPPEEVKEEQPAEQPREIQTEEAVAPREEIEVGESSAQHEEIQEEEPVAQHEEIQDEEEEPVAQPEAVKEETPVEKVSVEFSPDKPRPEQVSSQAESTAATPDRPVVTPPVKKDVEDHFNAHDGSGRLLSVFMQYYTCLNETCRGVVRVTMKDGICSLWNYDKWEEFAFVDIHEGQLRFTIDPRYAEEASSLEFCEVARLLASRRKFVAIQVGDLNQTMLGVLSKSFEEVGLTAG